MAPGEHDHAKNLNDIRVVLRRLERHDWYLWGAAVVVMLLLSLSIFTFAFPGLWREANPLFFFELDIAAHGLFGLVLLFSVFVIYQQVLIKRLRRDLAGQLARTATLETHAEVLEKLAVIDPLTDLYNRRFATEHLPVELARAARHGYPLTALMLDLNGFKEINDRYGHAAGDLALRQFARNLKRCFRSSDLPVRIGGDEFLVLLPECPAQELPHVLTHLHDFEVEYEGAKIPITFSAGWAEYQQGETAETLLARADQALYADKDTRSAEHQVRQAEARIAHTQRLQTMGEVAGGLAHDVNNLLTVIKGYAELAVERAEPGPARTQLEEIGRAADRAEALLKQALTLSRRRLLQPDQHVDLNRLVPGMELLLRSMLGSRITLRFDPGTDLGLIRADPTQVEQVVLNLAVNARDAMPKGGSLTVRTTNTELDDPWVRAHPGSRPGAYVALVVEDNGVGMDAETLRHIFEPFFTTKGNKGTGLGLSIVYGVVKQTGAYIWVDSEPGQGASFTIFFPRAAVRVPEAVRAAVG